MRGRNNILILGAGACLAGPAAAATLLNGGFEAGPGLSSWTSSGPAEAVTFELARDWLAISAFIPAGDIWLPVAMPSDTDYFASLWSTDLGGAASSSLSQSFDANAGDVLSFRYFLDFGEISPAPSDRLFGMLDLPTLADEVFFDVSRDDEENFDWALVTYVLPETGTYTLSFGAEDGDPGGFESILGIDNVRVTDGGPIIPLPTAGAMAGCGMLMLGVRRRRA